MAQVIEALAMVGGIGTTGALIAVVVLAFKLSWSKDDQLAARDRLEKLDEEFDALEVDRNGLKVELDSERQKTAELLDKVADVESQRNDAQRKERQYVVEMLKSANIADANQFIARLLAAPLVVHKAVPRSEEPTSGDGLLDPSEM